LLSKKVCIIRDISGRIRAQREIMESQKRFQDFAEASSDCFWEIDANLSNLKATSPGSVKHVAKVAQVLTRNPDGLANCSVMNKDLARLHAVFAAHDSFRDKRVAMFRDNGQRLNLSLSGKPLFDLEGNFIGYRGTARDVTEEVLARDAARHAQRRLIDAMNAAPNAIALIDAAMNFVAGNSTLSALVPDAAKHLQGRMPFPKFLEAAFTADGTIHDGMTPAELIHRIIHNGKRFEIRAGNKWLLIAGRTLSDHRAVLTFSDVTEIKERERELADAKKSAESANRLKSQFLATMSHELRTPLNAILGFSEVIRDQILGRDGPVWKRYIEYASSIYMSGRHLLALISEILDLSKIEAGTYMLDYQTIDLGVLVRETAALIKPTANRAGVEVCLSVPRLPVKLFADDRALRQITLNLLSNATKFTPRNGRVDVIVENDGTDARLIVEDTGIGIAEDDQALIFEPFTQVDASVRRRHEGTGLGLAITKRLVEMHGGKSR
jgi:two-component system sensor histidine kinase/response regulator